MAMAYGSGQRVFCIFDVADNLLLSPTCMMRVFILARMNETQVMPRKTIYIPDGTEEVVREHARKGESFSATVVRLIELGATEDVEFDPGPGEEDEEYPLGYIGSGKGGPPDLAINAEKYLGLEPWGPDEKPSDLYGDQQ